MFQEAGRLPSFTEQKLKWGPSNHWISLGSMLVGVVWWKDHLSCEMLCLWLLSALARNFHSASSTFTGFGAPSLVNLILWNRVQGCDSKTLLPDDLWPSEPSAQLKDFSIWKFRRPTESTNCRKLPLLFRLFAGVHVKITPYSQEFSKNHLYWTVLVTRPYCTVVSSIQDSCSLCDAPPVRATVSTGTPAARANRILSSNLWLADSNLPNSFVWMIEKNTSITWDFFA